MDSSCRFAWALRAAGPGMSGHVVRLRWFQNVFANFYLESSFLFSIVIRSVFGPH